MAWRSLTMKFEGFHVSSSRHKISMGDHQPIGWKNANWTKQNQTALPFFSGRKYVFGILLSEKARFGQKVMVAPRTRISQNLFSFTAFKRINFIQEITVSCFSWLSVRPQPKLSCKVMFWKSKGRGIISFQRRQTQTSRAIRLLWMKHLTLTGDLKPHATRVERS